MQRSHLRMLRWPKLVSRSPTVEGSTSTYGLTWNDHQPSLSEVMFGAISRTSRSIGDTGLVHCALWHLTTTPNSGHLVEVRKKMAWHLERR